MMSTDPRAPDLPEPLRRTVDLFERLTAEDTDRLDGYYAPQARFKDPFHDVRGVAAIRRVFEHMFHRLDDPRFTVLEVRGDERSAWMAWNFDFRFRGEARAQRIHGATRLAYDDDGRITEHRDYWDAAEELYEKLPVVGWLMRALKRAAAASPH